MYVDRTCPTKRLFCNQLPLVCHALIAPLPFLFHCRSSRPAPLPTIQSRFYHITALPFRERYLRSRHPVSHLVGGVPAAAVSVDHLLVVGRLSLAGLHAVHEAVGGLLVVVPRDVVLVLAGRRRLRLGAADRMSPVSSQSRAQT